MTVGGDVTTGTETEGGVEGTGVETEVGVDGTTGVERELGVAAAAGTVATGAETATGVVTKLKTEAFGLSLVLGKGTKEVAVAEKGEEDGEKGGAEADSVDLAVKLDIRAENKGLENF